MILLSPAQWTSTPGRQDKQSSNHQQGNGEKVCNRDAVIGAKGQQHRTFNRLVDQYPNHSGCDQCNG
jgi:hypothetical protein